MANKVLRGAKYRTLVRKAVKPANEGYNLEDIAELLRATEDRPGGLPMDTRYVYRVLHYAKYALNMPLRDGIKMSDRDTTFMFNRRYKKRQAKVKGFSVVKRMKPYPEKPFLQFWWLIPPALAAGALIGLAVSQR